MSEMSLPGQIDPGQTLEYAGNQFTILSAQAALSNAQRTGQTQEIAEALVRLAHLHFRQGRYLQTQKLAADVLREAAEDSPRRCDALRILGNCAAELGHPDEAEVYYHQAIDLARQLNYRYALYKCLHSLATNIYWSRGQFNLCLASGKEALTQAQALHVGEELWFPLSDIAWVYWNTGQRELATQIADQMDAVVPPDSLGAGFSCCLRAGQIEFCEGYLSRVLPLYERARSIAERTGDPGLNMEVRLGLCRAYRLAQDLSAAKTWAEDAVKTCERMNYRQLLSQALIERGRLAFEMGDLVNAEADLSSAWALSAQLQSYFDLTRARLYLAALLTGQNRPEAGVVWQHAVNLIFEHGYTFLIEQERSLLLPWIANNLNSAEPALANASAALFDRLTQIPPAPLQVKTFGQFAVWVGSAPVSKENLRQRRGGELLGLLLASPGYTLSADQVGEAMCPEKDPDASVDFYHHAISALRHVLEPDLPSRRFPCRYLAVTEERITLILPPNSSIDFLEFERCVQHREWGNAIATYGGEFLPLFRYMEWTVSLRQHFADLFEQALLAQAMERLADGDAAACLDLARRALLGNSWQEQAVELGMKAALQLGDRGTAIKIYQRLEKTLDKELGIAPQIKLRQLYADLKKRPRTD